MQQNRKPNSIAKSRVHTYTENENWWIKNEIEIAKQKTKTKTEIEITSSYIHSKTENENWWIKNEIAESRTKSPKRKSGKERLTGTGCARSETRWKEETRCLDGRRDLPERRRCLAVIEEEDVSLWSEKKMSRCERRNSMSRCDRRRRCLDGRKLDVGWNKEKRDRVCVELKQGQNSQHPLSLEGWN